MLPFASPMTDFELVLILLAAVAVTTAASRKLGLAAPILLVIVGLGLASLPFFPDVELPPEIVLVFFLPPLLFAAAWQTPLRGLKENRRPILLLSVGLVIFTTLVVGFVISATGALTLAAAITLGAIVSPPDALAATTVLKRLAVPRRILTILEGESLVNDATALVLYGTAVGAVTGGFVLTEVAGQLVLVFVGSIAIGLVVAVAASWLWARLFDPPVEIALSLLIPYVAYLPAEHLHLSDQLHLSGVIAVVTAGLVIGRRSSRILEADARVLGGGVWEIVTFFLNGSAFLLIGLSLPTVLEGLSDRPPEQLLGLALLISVTVIVARFVWVYPGTYLPRILVPSIRRNDPAPPWTAPFVISWAGMRGAVSLAAALALPLAFPDRDLVIFLAFVVILVTLVGQGLTLPAIVHRLGLRADGAADREEVIARQEATDAALQELDALTDEWPDHRPLIEQVAEEYRHRASHRPIDSDGMAGTDPEADEERREHLAILGRVISAQREAVIGLRDKAVISDEVLRRIERELDLEELRLNAEA